MFNSLAIPVCGSTRGKGCQHYSQGAKNDKNPLHTYVFLVVNNPVVQKKMGQNRSIGLKKRNSTQFIAFTGY